MSHIRDEADYNIGVVAAVDEVIRVSDEAHLPGIVAHMKALGPTSWGLSMALHERSMLDPRFGHVVNHDFASYHIATSADVGVVEVHWLNAADPYTNPIGSKGIGELGIVGTAAAIANAVHHATGIRVRDLPVTLDKLLQ